MAFTFGATGLNATNHSAAGTLFGYAPSTGFGANATNTSTSSAAGTLFSSGNSLNTTSGFGFSQQQKPATTGFGGFGTSSAPATSTAPTTNTGFGGFGQPQQQSATTGFGGFGTPSAPTTSTAPTSTGFGFGNTQTGTTGFGGFGTSSAPTTSIAPTTTTNTVFGGFGQPQQQSATTGFGGFGASSAPATSTAPTSTGFGFGNTQTGTTGFGGFGTSSAPTTSTTSATTGFGFGNTQTAKPATTGFGGFGQQQQPSTGFGGFGQQQQQPSTGFGGFGQNKTIQPPTTGFGGFGQPSTTTLGQTPSLQQSQPQQQQQNVWQQLALIRAHWDPSSPLCQFRHYFYNMVPPNEVHLYVRPPNQDEQLWNEAQKKNPDPSCMVPVLAIGFDDILKRMEIQDQQSELHKNKLEEISQRLETVQRNYELGSKARLDEHKRRHIDLTQRLIRLLRLVQTLRYKGFPLNEGEIALQKNFQNLASQPNSPDQLYNKVIHLWSQLQSIKKDRLQSFGQYDGNTLCTWETLNENDTNRIAKVLADEQQGLSHVINVLKKDMEDVDTLEANLKLKANYSKSFALSSK
ncbi:unnamed protein product [Cunninghamella blakesleeana]